MRIDGIDIADIGLKLLQEGTQLPGLPATRDRSVVIPMRPGAYDFGADLEPLHFELALGAVVEGQAGNAKAKVQEVIESLKRLLLDSGRPRAVELELESVFPDRLYKVRYAGSLPVERIVRLGRFTLPVVAYDPRAYALYWESREQTITTTGTLDHLEVDGSVMPQLEIEVEFTSTSTGNITLQLNTTGPLLTFTGTANFGNGDILLIDRDKYIATLNGDNALPLLTAGDMEDFKFTPGSDHDLTVTLNAGTADVEARWRPRWQ